MYEKTIFLTHSSNSFYMKKKKKQLLPKAAGVMNLLLSEATHWENAHHDDSHADTWRHKCAPIGFACSKKWANPVTEFRISLEMSSMNISKYWLWDLPSGPVAWQLCASNAGGPGSITGQGTRSHVLQLGVHMPQLKILHAAIRTQHS